MSGSRGNLFTLKDWVSVANPESFRYLNFSRKPNGVIELNLRDNSFLIAMEEFERAERIFYGKEHAQSGKLDKRIARSYELSLIGKPEKEIPQRVSYSFSILLSQLFDPENNIGDVEDLMLNTAHIERKLNKDEEKTVQLQLKRTKNWIDKFAPDNYKIKFLEDASSANISANVKELFKEIAPIIDNAKDADDLQTKIYELTKSKNIAPKEMFQALYAVLIGKQFGPKIVVDELFAHEWLYISHIFRTPFYCYAYAFGNLLVLSLYEQYRREGKAFVPKVILTHPFNKASLLLFLTNILLSLNFLQNKSAFSPNLNKTKFAPLL